MKLIRTQEEVLFGWQGCHDARVPVWMALDRGRQGCKGACSDGHGPWAARMRYPTSPLGRRWSRGFYCFLPSSSSSSSFSSSSFSFSLPFLLLLNIIPPTPSCIHESSLLLLLIPPSLVSAVPSLLPHFPGHVNSPGRRFWMGWRGYAKRRQFVNERLAA